MPDSRLPPQMATQFPGNGSAERPVRHLNQVELSRRWSISPRTLERWRWLKAGPPYLKVGGRVLYRLEDVQAFEASQLHIVGPAAVKDKEARP